MSADWNDSSRDYHGDERGHYCGGNCHSGVHGCNDGYDGGCGHHGIHHYGQNYGAAAAMAVQA